MTLMEKPEIIKNGMLKYLKLLDLEDIIKETEKLDVCFRCSNCNIELNQENSYILPCGHLICNGCNNIKRCPMCDKSIDRVQKIYFNDICAICYDHKPNIASSKCGHICMCYECSLKNSSNGFKCPLCNEPCDNIFIADDSTRKTFNFTHK